MKNLDCSFVTSADVDRAFDPTDLSAMQALRRAAFELVFRSFRDIVGPEIAACAFAGADAEQAKLLDDICATQSTHHVRVAVHGGSVVGFVSFSVDVATRVGEVGLTAVHPDVAGRGIGTRMVEEVLREMKALGAVVATVGTGGDPSHAPARRAYEKAGVGSAIPSVYLYKAL